MKIKFTAAYAGYEAGTVHEIEDGIARAYVASGKAEAAPAAAEDRIVGDVNQEIARRIDGGFAELSRGLTAELKAQAAAGRPAVNSTTVEPGESEDEKISRKGGFPTLAHFARAVQFAFAPSAQRDSDAVAAVSKYTAAIARVIDGENRGFARGASGMSVSVDPDGGALIPPDFNNTIWERVRALNSIVDMIDMMPIDGNSYRMPADAETSRTDGNRRGGIQGFWEGEAAQYQKSKPTFSDRYLRLRKLTALVFLTNEDLEDAGVLEGYLNRVAPEEINFKVLDALIRGTGAGMPLGFKNAPCKIQVPKEPGQATNTIVAANAIKMWYRLYAPSRATSVWLCNQDAEQQLQQMFLPTGTNSGQLVYMGPNGLSGSSYGTLNGRPVIPIEQCDTVGTEGDLMLVDPKQIMAIKKRAGLQSSMSIHLRFDFDETAFKFMLRMDAQPAWSATLTPYKGTNTQSPIVTLQSRP